MRSLRLLALVLVVVPLGACNESSLPPPPDLAGRAPKYHRPTVSTCPTTRAAVDACKGGMLAPDGGTFGNQCLLDGDCTTGPGTNGRCVGRRSGCACSYDACVSDGDCGAGKACDCRDAAYPELSATRPNQCVAANCGVDSDCAGGHGYCSPTLDPTCTTYAGITGWYCHTTADECLDDSDCTHPPSPGPSAGFCVYKPEVGHWACTYGFCAG